MWVQREGTGSEGMGVRVRRGFRQGGDSGLEFGVGIRGEGLG